jgi:hypothetical protein
MSDMIPIPIVFKRQYFISISDNIEFDYKYFTDKRYINYLFLLQVVVIELISDALSTYMFAIIPIPYNSTTLNSRDPLLILLLVAI